MQGPSFLDVQIFWILAYRRLASTKYSSNVDRLTERRSNEEPATRAADDVDDDFVDFKGLPVYSSPYALSVKARVQEGRRMYHPHKQDIHPL